MYVDVKYLSSLYLLRSAGQTKEEGVYLSVASNAVPFVRI